jgi:hypothetical protein
MGFPARAIALAPGVRLAVSRSRVERERIMRNGIRIGWISGINLYLDWRWIFIFSFLAAKRAGSPDIGNLIPPHPRGQNASQA